MLIIWAMIEAGTYMFLETTVYHLLSFLSESWFSVLNLYPIKLCLAVTVPLTYAVDLSEVTGKEQMEAQPAKKGRGRKQWLCRLLDRQIVIDQML